MASSEPDSTSGDATVQVGARSAASAPVAGTTIGRYLVIDEVGAGGMGVVLRAYDPKLQREVALKRVRTGTMDALGSARIVREARAMAKLAHPNVVAVYDVDLEHDGIVLAMEFVDGVTLRTWLAERRAWSDVVRTFISAGRGLAAAHAVGLLHRDFKPANVLVGTDHRVRVTDFGLARAPRGTAVSDSSRSRDDEPAALPTSSSSIEVDLDSLAEQLTAAGIVEGTPQYMAPEQHEGAELSEAADQYAFCVALWEGLTGELPFRGRGMPLLLAKRAGPPTWPKTPGVPRTIARAVRRGLSPLARDRFATMDALLAALEHGLNRPRRLLVVGGATLLGAVAIAAWLPWFTRPEPCSGGEEQLEGVWDAARRDGVTQAMLATGASYASDTAQRLQVEIDEYTGAWLEQRREACEATAVTKEQSTEVLDLRMGCLDRAWVDLASAIDLLAQADKDVVLNAHRILGGLPALSACADVEALRDQIPPPDRATAQAVDAARERLGRAHALQRAGKYAEARDELVALHDHAATLGYEPLRIDVAITLASVISDLGDFEDGAARLEIALREALELELWDSATRAASLLGALLGLRLVRLGEGLAYLRIADGLSRRTGVSPDRRSQVLSALGSVYKTKGDWVEAERAHRSALELRIALYGEHHPDVARTRGNLGNVLFSINRRAEAELELRKAADVLATALGPNHPDVGAAHNNLAVVLQNDGRYAEAELAFRHAVEVRVASVGDDHPDTWLARANRAVAVRDLGRVDESERELRAALDGLERALGAGHPHVESARNNLGNTLRTLGRCAEAEALFREVLRSWESTLGPDHPDVAVVLLNLARCAQEREATDEVTALASRALAVREKAFAPDDSGLIEPLMILADIDIARGRDRAARERLERVVGICSARSEAPVDCTEAKSALERLAQP